MSEGEAVLKARLALAALDPVFQSDHPTLMEFCTRSYLPTVAHHSTAWKDQILWALDHIGPRFGNIPIDTIGRRQIQAFLSSKMEGRDKLSRSSTGTIRKVFHAIMELAEVDEVITRNPVAKIKLAPERKVKVRPYTLEEVAMILRAAESHACHNGIYMAASAGYTRDEAIGALWTDLRENVLTIERQGTKESVKTYNRARMVPVCEDWPKGLESTGRRLHMSPERNPRNLLGSPTMKRDDGRTETGRGFHRAVEVAGVRKGRGLTYHSLRKTFATELEKAGCPEGLISMALGHSAKRVTRLYIHDDLETLRVYVETVQLRLLEIRDKLGTTKKSSGARTA